MAPEELNEMDEVLKTAFKKATERLEKDGKYNFDQGGFAFSALAEVAQARVAVHNAQQQADRPKQSTTTRQPVLRREVDGRGGFGNRG